MNPGLYGPLDSATNLYTGLPINRQRVSKATSTAHPLEKLQQTQPFDPEEMWGQLGVGPAGVGVLSKLARGPWEDLAD